MWNKIKTKLTDALFTFIGSILALIISSKFSSNIKELLKQLSISDSNIEKILGFIFALLVVFGFVICMLFWEVLKLVFVRPKILITYTNEINEHLETISFTENYEEPQFIRIKFSTKFNKFQLTFLKMMQSRLKVEINPKIFSVELNDGFESDEHSEIINNVLYFKIFDLYSSSGNEMQIFKDLQLQRISAGVSEIKFSMEIHKPVFKWFMFNYCVFDVGNLQIEG